MEGSFLKKKIQSAGFQLYEVAKKLDITPQDLQSKLKSKDVKLSLIRKIASAINKDVFFFLEDDSPFFESSVRNLILRDGSNGVAINGDNNINGSNVNVGSKNKSSNVSAPNDQVRELTDMLKTAQDQLSESQRQVSNLIEIISSKLK